MPVVCNYSNEKQDRKTGLANAPLSQAILMLSAAAPIYRGGPHTKQLTCVNTPGQRRGFFWNFSPFTRNLSETDMVDYPSAGHPDKSRRQRWAFL